MRTVKRVQATGTARWVRRIDEAGGIIGTSWLYLHRDHLGSVDAVTSASGVLLNGKTSFDPFGARRQHSWASDITTASLNTLLASEQLRFQRGFTDHEQLNRTGFVHMNGRVYDTRIGRFVSPDPIVVDPGFSQSHNRYSYVMNSPMSFTDPSGFVAQSKKKVVAPNACGSTGCTRSLEETLQTAPGCDAYCQEQSRQWIDGVLRGRADPGNLEEMLVTAKRIGRGDRPVVVLPQGQGESADPICNAAGLGGGGLTLSQRAERARFQALGGVVGGALLGPLPAGAVLGYVAAIGYNAVGLRAGGALVQGGSRQGNLAYGAATQGLGIPLPAAQRFAGFYEQFGPSSGGRYAAENGTFLGGPPFGDDPQAQQAIAEGYACGQ